jgi:bacteriorhodopsin
MNFPVRDWQFWAVTAAFVLALLWLFRGMLFRSRRRRRAHRATLTVSGKPVDR